MCTKVENCGINFNVEIIMEDHMKIVKKIFAVSSSAILGLSFCSGTAFASKTFTDNSKIIVERPIPIRPKPGRGLRRSPGAYFTKDGKMVSINGSKLDIRSLTYSDYEKFEGLDIYSFLHGIEYHQ